LRLEDDDYERLRALAFIERRSIADVVRAAIRVYVDDRMEPGEVHVLVERALGNVVTGRRSE
jgi:predicted DNA-binding protein